MSRNLDLLQAAYQRAGRDGVDAVVDLLDPQVEWIAAQPGPWDCHDREQVVETFRRKYDHGSGPTSASPLKSAIRSSSTCAPTGVTISGCGRC